MRVDRLWPPMEAGSALDLLALLGEGDALGGDFFFEICRRDVLVDDRLIDKRQRAKTPQLNLWRALRLAPTF
jgi:hypothetical protein